MNCKRKSGKSYGRYEETYKNEEIKKATTEPKAVSQSTAMQERMESVSRKILITARNELYMKMRFLDVALSSAFHLYWILVRTAWERMDCTCIMIRSISGDCSGKTE
ncbi:MAG: hypothetical protein ACLR08_07495 [Dorea longicatena]